MCRSSRARPASTCGLVGRDGRRVRGPHDQRGHRRRQGRVGQGLAELRHVQRPRGAALERGPLQHAGVERVRRRARDVGEAAAAVTPRTGEGRDARDGAVGDRRAGVTLRADAEADQRRLHRRDLVRERADHVAGDVAEGGTALDRVVAEALDQLVVPDGVRAAPLLVGEAGVEQRAQDAERQRAVGAGQRREVLVGDARRAAAEGVDHDQLRAVAAGEGDQAPQVRCRRHRVPAPADDQLRPRPLLRIDLGRLPRGDADAGGAGRGADGAHEARGADGRHEPVGHRTALQRRPSCRGTSRAAPTPGRAARSPARSRLRPGRAPRPRSPRGTRPSPSRRCGSAGAAGAPASRRARGSRTPCRRGSRP